MTAPVFLIGSQRSGTTWLQCMLGAHPAIAAPQEPEFFTQYVAKLHNVWAYELRTIGDETSSSRLKGVASVMTTEEFTAMVRDMVGDFHRVVLALKPGATIVMEKCPEYHRALDVIRTYVPDARFIHLVRDGRDVVESLVAASKGWGSRWAPADIDAAATMWARAVKNARSAADTNPYLELRYEDLLAGPEPFARALAFCEAEATPAQVDEISAADPFDELRADPTRPYRAGSLSAAS